VNWQEYEDETTEDIIEYIKMKEDDGFEEAAQAAFHVFCFRFGEDLVRKCEVICKNNGLDKHVAAMISQRTFHRFWKYPKYNHEKSRAADYDTGVKFYLYRIAQRELINWRNEQNSPYTGEEEIVYEMPEPDYYNYAVEKRGVLKKRYEIVKKALDRLSEKHRIIYLTYEAHFVEGHNLPGHLLKRLREELNLTQNSVRFYRHQANEKIKEYIEIYG